MCSGRHAWPAPLIATALLALAFAGCCLLPAETFISKQDVSTDPTFWGGFQPGSRFVLQQPCFIGEWRGVTCLIEPSASWHSMGSDKPMPSIATWQARPADFPFIKGVVQAGEPLTVVRLVRVGNDGSGGSRTEVWAQSRGHGMVNLGWLSIRDERSPYPIVRAPREDYLNAVAPGTSAATTRAADSSPADAADLSKP